MNPFALGVRAIALYNARNVELRVVGAENVPARGAALVAARHYHHLYDGVALTLGLRRQPHIFVALDWARSPLARLAMETVCNLAEWPVALRTENLGEGDGSAFARDEVRRYARKALERASDLLGRGEVLVMFPEAYPTMDPAGSRKAADDAFLPFRSGVATIARRVARTHGANVPIVPAGLAYRSLGGGRYAIALRLGPPLYARAGDRALLAELRDRVRELSTA